VRVTYRVPPEVRIPDGMVDKRSLLDRSVHP
jgi:hypothetical protein